MAEGSRAAALLFGVARREQSAWGCGHATEVQRKLGAATPSGKLVLAPSEPPRLP